MDKQSKEKVSKKTTGLNDIIDKIDLTDVYKIFHLQTTDYPSSSATNGKFSKLLGQEANFTKYQKICIFHLKIMNKI